MKVTVERADLLRSLSHVHRVVERRNTIPILANVLVRADRSQLSFKATDLDLEVVEAIAAEVSPGGVTTVPAHMFYEIEHGDDFELALGIRRKRSVSGFTTIDSLAAKQFYTGLGTKFRDLDGKRIPPEFRS